MIGILCNGLVYRFYEFRPGEHPPRIHKSDCFHVLLKANMGWKEARDAVKDILSRILQILLDQVDAYSAVMP